MANLKVSEQAYPSTRYTEAAAPSTPASGEVIVYAKSDGLLYSKDDAGVETQVTNASAGSVATDAIWDAAGDLAVGTGANTAAKLTIGSSGQVLTSNGTTAAWATPTAATVFSVPTPVQHPAGVFASATTVAVTVSAPTVGNRLIAFIASAARGANSITQTNVTWTNLFTGNGNSLFTEIWTGVVASSPGTTATANFTGSNSNYMEIIELPSTYPAFSAAGTPVTATAASGTVYTCGPLVTASGDYVCWLIAAGQASSYSILTQPYLPLTPFGGFGRFGFLRSSGGEIALTSINVSSNAFRATLVVLS